MTTSNKIEDFIGDFRVFRVKTWRYHF